MRLVGYLKRNNNNIQFIKLLYVKRNIIAIHQNKNIVKLNPITKRTVRITKVIHVHHMAKTPKRMNNLDATLRKVEDSKFVSGLATVYRSNRFFRCLLQIADCLECLMAGHVGCSQQQLQCCSRIWV